jgi:hypothetical protein
MVDSIQILYIFRAIFFGVLVGASINLFFRYAKPMIENLAGGKSINVDLWWWTGVSLSFILGTLSMLFLLYGI